MKAVFLLYQNVWVTRCPSFLILGREGALLAHRGGGPSGPARGPLPLKLSLNKNYCHGKNCCHCLNYDKINLKFYCIILRLYSIKSVKGLQAISASLQLEIVMKNCELKCDVVKFFVVKFLATRNLVVPLAIIISYLRINMVLQTPYTSKSFY